MRTLRLTTPHIRNPKVLHLQQLLKQHGWYHGALDSELGPFTAQAVARAKYRLGYPHPNQIAGARLISYLDGSRKPTDAMVKLAHQRKLKPPPHRTKGHDLIAYELTQVGVTESPAGSNRQKYGVWYGANGLPWCAMFQSFCANHVGLTFKYAYVPYVVADARAGRNGLHLVHKSDVFVGCFVCFDWTGDGTADHIGCFEKWVDKDAGSFRTVEGNTSMVGENSNGGEVCHQTRNVSQVQAFVAVHGVKASV